MMKQHNYAFEDAAAKRFLCLARQFENLAETYREVRLHGPAADAEAWKGLCEYLVAARPELSKTAHRLTELPVENA